MSSGVSADTFSGSYTLWRKMFIMEANMKKVRIQKIMAVLLAAVVAFGMLGIGTGSAYAASHKWTLGISETIYVGDTGWVGIYDQMSSDYTEATLTKVTSSNKSIVKVHKGTDGNDTWYYLEGKKKGKAKITVKYKTPQGKTGTKSKTVQVKPYPKHLKSIYVNGKKVKLSEHRYDYYKSTKKTSVKIKMATKNGWKISSVYATYFTKSGNDSEAKVTKKMVKNGTAIKFPKKYQQLSINVNMVKGDEYISYYFGFFR